MKLALFRLLLWVSGRFDLKANQQAAERLSGLVWRFSRRHRQVIQANIRACFPELPPVRQESLARQSLIETLKTALELGSIWRRYGRNVDVLIREVKGFSAVQAAVDSGRGLIIAAPHLGNWEVLGLFLSRLPNFALLYKPPDVPGIEPILLANRGQAGAHQVAATPAGVRRLLKTLKTGGVVGILPDQNPKAGQGGFAPFFGRPTYTMTLLSRLAGKTGVPVFVAAAIRRADGLGFDLHFAPCSEAVNGPLDKSLVSLNMALEDMVRRAPAQYQWSYKRFSIVPKGYSDIYQPRKDEAG